MSKRQRVEGRELARDMRIKLPEPSAPRQINRCTSASLSDFTFVRPSMWSSVEHHESHIIGQSWIVTDMTKARVRFSGAHAGESDPKSHGKKGERIIE